MNGKSVGSGLINEEGKIVKEIEARLDALRILTEEAQERGEYLTNYQNDNMGAPTEEFFKKADRLINEIIADGPSMLEKAVEFERAKKAKVVKFRGKK